MVCLFKKKTETAKSENFGLLFKQQLGISIDYYTLRLEKDKDRVAIFVTISF